MDKHFGVRNVAQVVLYECEMKGQMSDGFWENSLPNNHWRQPCEADAFVGSEEELGRNFFIMRMYNFANPELLEWCGDRMLFWVRCIMAHPELIRDLDNHWDWEKRFAKDLLVASQPYDMKQLRKDLRDMTNLFRIEPKL